MGYKIAEVASRRRHAVTLVSGPTRLTPPKVKKFIPIETAGDLLKTLRKEIKDCDCLIMCAAVGDFRPQRVFEKKLKRKKTLSLKLIPNKDILKELSSDKQYNLFVGFSLETENLLKSSVKKMKTKKLDMIVANKWTKLRNPFGDNKLDIIIIDKTSHRVYLHNKSKAYIAQVLLDKIEKLWYEKRDK